MILYRKTGKPVVLEDIASADLIARSDKADLARIRAIIANVTLDSLMTDDVGKQQFTFRELVNQHLAAGDDKSEEEGGPLDYDGALGFAFGDIVFFGFHPVDERQ
jgi:hypothetical protein